jgi:hypothetical protein
LTAGALARPNSPLRNRRAARGLPAFGFKFPLVVIRRFDLIEVAIGESNYHIFNRNCKANRSMRPENCPQSAAQRSIVAMFMDAFEEVELDNFAFFNFWL